MSKAKAVLTEAEFCAAVDISRTTARQLRRTGKLPYCRIGRKILYRPEHVEIFLQSAERNVLGARDEATA